LCETNCQSPWVICVAKPVGQQDHWAQAGRVTEPGRYMESEDEYRLGTFELREIISLSEK
jgi:hypothetical protein